ncbi:MAG TPA: sodium/proline symporter [Alphaproteobacteria bacterium]
MILGSFVAFLLAFLAIGLASTTRSRGTSEDYYLASRDVSPMAAGLSAIATNNSGYMFIGVIGYTYATGLPSIWLMVGWILGDFLASLFVHRKLRIACAATDEATFGGVLSRWNGTDFAHYRRVAAVITVVFLGAYAAAQFSAGGKALHALFGWDPKTGAVMVSVVVVLYCFAGGIRASIWTDVAQSVVMLTAMAVLFFTAVDGLGGFGEAWRRMGEVPGFLDWFPGDLLLPGAAGMVLFVLGWMFAGLSVIGQPHVMVRFMALKRAGRMAEVRVWYYGFFTVFYALATGVGMLSRLYLPDLAGLDPELALPTMARELLPPVVVGLILAGIFAATMSTADSLILSCSAAVTHDLAPRRLETPLEIKGATVLVTALALGLALSENESVFSLVILAWSVLASAFAPLLVVYAVGGRPGEALALTMSITGVAVALLWRQLGWHETVYEGMPGILAGALVYLLLKRVLAEPAAIRAAGSGEGAAR